MTKEEIEKKILELQEQKKILIQKEKAKIQKEKARENARKRKIENRVKFIIGGYVLKKDSEFIDKVIKIGNLREQDLKTLQEYKNLLNH